MKYMATPGPTGKISARSRYSKGGGLGSREQSLMVIGSPTCGIAAVRASLLRSFWSVGTRASSPLERGLTEFRSAAPTSPETMARFTRAKFGSKRRCSAVMSLIPAFSHTRIASIVSGRSVAMGFSQKTSLPAAAHFMICSAWNDDLRRWDGRGRGRGATLLSIHVAAAAFAAPRRDRISTSRPRRRHDSSLQNIHVAAAASPRNSSPSNIRVDGRSREPRGAAATRAADAAVPPRRRRGPCSHGDPVVDAAAPRPATRRPRDRRRGPRAASRSRLPGRRGG